MAAGVALIFHYFALQFQLWTGLYSLAICLTSFMVWMYVMEARPYALWFFLTAIQMISLLRLADDNNERSRVYWLGLANFLLGFTVIFSLIQNAVTSVLAWRLGVRDWRFSLGFLLPASASLFYAFHAPKYSFWLAESFMGLLGASLPVDRILIIAAGAVVDGSCRNFERH